MTTGIILDDGNISILEKPGEYIDREENGIVDETVCQYGTRYAYWTEPVLGSCQKYLGETKCRGEIIGGVIEKTEVVDRFPKRVTL